MTSGTLVLIKIVSLFQITYKKNIKFTSRRGMHIEQKNQVFVKKLKHLAASLFMWTFPYHYYLSFSLIIQAIFQCKFETVHFITTIFILLEIDLYSLVYICNQIFCITLDVIILIKHQFLSCKHSTKKENMNKLLSQISIPPPSATAKNVLCKLLDSMYLRCIYIQT